MGNKEVVKFIDDEQDFEYTCISSETLVNPLSLTVQITRQCNLNCVWCSEANQIKDSSMEEIKLIADKLDGLGRVYISGGEPLMRKDFKEIVEVFSDKVPNVALLTNATLIDKEMAVFLKDKIKYAKVGLDGVENVNDTTRGMYYETIRGIKILLSVGIDVTISTIILKSTSRELFELIILAEELGVKQLKLIEPVNRGRGKNQGKENVMERKNMDLLMDDISEWKEKNNWKINVEYTYWDEETRGYSLLLYPNFEVHTWPHFDMETTSKCVGI